MVRISARPANWSFSSKWVTAMYPNGTLIDLIFIGSSAPRNMIFCPVGLYTSSSGWTLADQYAAMPSSPMAHRYCAYTLSAAQGRGRPGAGSAAEAPAATRRTISASRARLRGHSVCAHAGKHRAPAHKTPAPAPTTAEFQTSMTTFTGSFWPSFAPLSNAPVCLPRSSSARILLAYLSSLSGPSEASFSTISRSFAIT